MRLILTLTTQSEIFGSRSQKSSIFWVEQVGSWLEASGWFWTVGFIYERVESVVLCRVQNKNMWKMWKEMDRVPAPGAGLRPGLPGEVLLQRHHLLPALLRRRPLPSLHTQMLFNLQLQIMALLDQCRCRCSCRETRKLSCSSPLL